ncbi:MAG TPA: hypothetical protein VNF08_06360 [Acidimicrobiales bacterium]|nr:hypothetical protein [Acidimicrobiales bacterium]
MAVRDLELTELRTPRLHEVRSAPKRREIRRSKQRYALLGALAVAVPFFGALVALGVAH